MMVSFDFLSFPIDLSYNKISVLYIENHQLFRNTLRSFYDGDYFENGIVFSENYEPIKSKGDICFIPDLFNLNFSGIFIKKLYEDLSVYSNTYFSDRIAQIKSSTVCFLEALSQSYEFDFSFKDEIDITDILKMQNFKPSVDGDLLEKLIDYITVVKKYSTVKCFILTNIHNYFSGLELEQFYKELIYKNITVLLIENQKYFETFQYEKTIIVDEDLCEIVD